MMSISAPDPRRLHKESINPRSGMDDAPLTLSEQIALEFLDFRRRQGWQLSQCRDEVLVLAAKTGLIDFDIPLRNWDDIAHALAHVWEGLPAGTDSE